MLIDSGNRAALVVCTTCGVSKNQREEPEGRCDGDLLLEALQAAIVGHPVQGELALQPMPCLFACTSHCTVHIRAPGKMGYLLGRFSPTAEDATALLDYMAAYLQSHEGVVGFADWPEGVKGHFIARLPPQGYVWTDGPVGA